MRLSLVIIFLGIVFPGFVNAEENHKVAIAKQKCTIELQQEYVPIHCYRWLNGSSLPVARKLFLKDWFNSACKKALQKNSAAAEFHMTALTEVDTPCREALSTAFQEWSYQAREIAPDRLLILMSQTGKKIEYRGEHGMESKRRANSRIIGRGAN